MFSGFEAAGDLANHGVLTPARTTSGDQNALPAPVQAVADLIIARWGAETDHAAYSRWRVASGYLEYTIPEMLDRQALSYWVDETPGAPAAIERGDLAALRETFWRNRPSGSEPVYPTGIVRAKGAVVVAAEPERIMHGYPTLTNTTLTSHFWHGDPENVAFRPCWKPPEPQARTPQAVATVGFVARWSDRRVRPVIAVVVQDPRTTRWYVESLSVGNDRPGTAFDWEF
ncbi:MAG: hypothetical protein EA378_10550 [Phycisphaerales bacterium]|nr:MAG: hypothetical protein EA378_10550 [Phycisphaerales bacterium]